MNKFDLNYCSCYNVFMISLVFHILLDTSKEIYYDLKFDIIGVMLLKIVLIKLMWI